MYGRQRDVSLIRHLNRELLHKLINTRVLIYKVNQDSTKTNIYGESDSKKYYPPVEMACIVTADDQQWNFDDYSADVTQTGTFSFFRDDLVKEDFVVQVGDIVEYRSRFFEIDSVADNQLFTGKDPQSAFTGNEFGMNVSINCQAHMTRQSKLNIVKTRFGNNRDSSYTSTNFQ